MSFSTKQVHCRNREARHDRTVRSVMHRMSQERQGPQKTKQPKKEKKGEAEPATNVQTRRGEEHQNSDHSKGNVNRHQPTGGDRPLLLGSRHDRVGSPTHGTQSPMSPDFGDHSKKAIFVHFRLALTHTEQRILVSAAQEALRGRLLHLGRGCHFGILNTRSYARF